jgi:glucose-1-phosphate thymidylyltransferase
MKGLIMAGGTGSRLLPLTSSLSKQLLPIFDKPMIHYPIATLMASGVRDICIITTERDLPLYENLLGDGSSVGISIQYKKQNQPKGIAEAFLLTPEFISGGSVALILGDNLFHGVGLGRELEKYNNPTGAQIFAYSVSNPGDYGVVTMGKNGETLNLIEKPSAPESNLAVPGLYFYNSDVVEVVKQVRPSVRGELEITSLNEIYLSSGRLNTALMPRGTAWFDTGTFENLLDASNYVRIIQERQGIKISCLEEVAWRRGWINDEQLLASAKRYPEGNPYNNYLSGLVGYGSLER